MWRSRVSSGKNSARASVELYTPSIVSGQLCTTMSSCEKLFIIECVRIQFFSLDNRKQEECIPRRILSLNTDEEKEDFLFKFSQCPLPDMEHSNFFIHLHGECDSFSNLPFFIFMPHLFDLALFHSRIFHFMMIPLM